MDFQKVIMSTEAMRLEAFESSRHEEKIVFVSPFRQGQPKYRSIKNDILYNIHQKTFLPGDRIPPESWYCRVYSVSTISVRKTFSDLIREDVLFAKQGKGTFVKRRALHWRTTAGNFAQNVASQVQTPETRILSVEQLQDNAISTMFELAPNVDLTCLKRLRLADGEPTAVSVSYMPADVFSMDDRIFLERQGFSLYKVLAGKRIEPYSTRETFSVEIISEKSIYDLLHYGHNEPLIYGERHNYDENGRLFEYTRNYLRSDIYKIVCYNERML